MMMVKSWNEMDLKTYRELYVITSNYYMDEGDKRFRAAALLNGISYEQLLEQPINITAEMVDGISFLFERPKPEKVRKEYVLNGNKYVFIKDMEDITTAQYIDYQALSTEPFEEHLLDLMYIMLIPKGKNYNDGYDRDEALNDLGTLSVTEALGIADFFIKRYRRLLTRTLLYSNAMLRVSVMRAPKEMRKELKEKIKENSKEVNELLSMFGSLSLKQLLK